MMHSPPVIKIALVDDHHLSRHITWISMLRLLLEPFYEIGIAHTLIKDVLLLCQSMDDVPFDLRHRRVLIYDISPKGCKKLERTIVENVNAILKATA